MYRPKYYVVGNETVTKDFLKVVPSSDFDAITDGNEIPRYVGNLIILVDNINNYEKNTTLYSEDGRVEFRKYEDVYRIEFDKVFIVSTNNISKQNIISASEYHVNEDDILVHNSVFEWKNVAESIYLNAVHKSWYNRIWDMIPEFEPLV